MRLMLLWMPVLLSCASAGGPASRAAYPATMDAVWDGPEGPTSAPAKAARAPASKGPSSYPALDGEAVRELLAGVELEKGDLASDRDRALERAKLAEAFGRSEQRAVTAANVRTWLVGVGVALVVGVIAFFAGEAAAGKFTTRAPLAPNEPMVPQ